MNHSYLLQVGANNSHKVLLKFDVSTIPTGKKVDEATLRLYYTGRTNSNTLTIGTHHVLAAWTDSQVNRNYRQTGVAWAVAGMDAGSDYDSTATDAVTLSGAAGQWVTLTVTAAAQAWVQNPATNYGLALLEQSSSGAVWASFCAELGWCGTGTQPKLIITYTVPSSLAAREVEAEPHALADVVITKYYYLGSTRVAMRQADALYYLFSDHLSTSSGQLLMPRAGIFSIIRGLQVGLPRPTRAAWEPPPLY